MAGFLDGELGSTSNTLNYNLLGNPFITAIANDTKTKGTKVTVDTVLSYVFKFGVPAVQLLSQIGVIKNKNLAQLQEIAQRGYNQNDIAALAGQLDLSALQKEVDNRNASDTQDKTFLYVGLAFIFLVAIYLITKQSEPKQYQPIEYKQYRKR